MNRTPIVAEARVVVLLERIVDELGAVRSLLEGRCESRERLLNATEVADLLGVDPRTLRALRHEGEAPRCVLVGRSPKWRPRDVDAWLTRRSAA